MRHLTIALDAMGGDFGPTITVPAAIKALLLYPHIKMFLVGNPTVINPLIINDSFIRNRLTVICAKSIISNDAKPSQAIRTSHGTSMRIALELIKVGKAQACVSAGNTGVLMGLAKILLRPLKGIHRPALMVVLPNKEQGKTILLDLGANIECDSKVLAQFAMIGSVMAQQIIGIEKPRVALLNIGEEETKGLDTIKQAATLLKTSSSINYIGYLEANELLTGRTDVMVCDGFIGNITLKTMEGVIRVFLSMLKSSKNNKQTYILTLLNKWIKKHLTNRLGFIDPDQYNGACLIGLCGIVIKSHGSANQRAFIAAIEQAIQAIEGQIPERIAAKLSIDVN